MTKPLDVQPKEPPRATLSTPEEAENWVEELIDLMLVARGKCDVIVPGDHETQVKQQQRASWSFLVRHGEVIGALKTLVLFGLIPEKLFVEMNQKAVNALVPTLVGATVEAYYKAQFGMEPH